MAERHTIKLTAENQGKALAWLAKALTFSAGKPWVMELREAKRSDDQNDALHGLIDQILKQRPRHVGMRMTKESYKAVFMHALGREAPMIPNLDGDGFFPMGLSTSKLTVSECSELIESILAWCAREGLTIKHFGEFDPRRDDQAEAA